MRAIILIMIIFGVLLSIIGSFLLAWGYTVSSISGFNDWLRIGASSFLIGVGLLVLSVPWLRTPKEEEVKEKLLEDDEDKAIEILKQRYAKGEIAKEEFEQMKKDLENS